MCDSSCRLCYFLDLCLLYVHLVLVLSRLDCCLILVFAVAHFLGLDHHLRELLEELQELCCRPLKPLKGSE